MNKAKAAHETVLKAIEDDNFLAVDNVFLPYLGKCICSEFKNAELLNIKPLRIERYDKEIEARYDIRGLYGDWLTVNVDYKNLKIEGAFVKCWIGGLVEEFKFTFNIYPDSFSTRKHLDILFITFAAQSGEIEKVANIN